MSISETEDQCVVLYSGGQDSTVCLLLAIQHFGHDNVYPLSFTYHQSHKIELKRAAAICEELGVRQPKVLPATALHILGGSALTDDEVTVSSDATGSGNVYAEQHGLPSTVVPGRNLLFLTLAAAYGAKLGIYNLWTGGCLADRDGYPDCRWEFYNAAEQAISLALAERMVRILTPLIDVSKADTFRIAEELGQLELVRDRTHTCYLGNTNRNEWGYGCGNCPACVARYEGYNEFMVSYHA